MFNSKWFEDYSLGESRETSGRTITETDIVLHAGQSGDFYPHHMDAQWCQGQEFGQRIAHGTLIISVSVGMGAGEVNMAAFTYGYDRIRFVRPVYIGDTLHVKITVHEKRDYPKRPDLGLVVERLEAMNQRLDVVLVLDHLLLVTRRNSAEEARP